MPELESQEKKADPKVYFKEAYNDFDPKPLEGKQLQSFYIEAFSQSAVEELLTTIEITEQYRKLLVVGHRGCGKSTILNKICQNLDTHTVVAFSVSDVVNMSEIEAIDILLATYLKILEHAHIIEEQKAKEEKAAQSTKEKKNDLARGREAEARRLLKESKTDAEKGNPQQAKDKEQKAHSLLKEVEHIKSDSFTLLEESKRTETRKSESERTPVFHKMTGAFKDLLRKLTISIDLNETSFDLLGLISFKYRVEPETRADLRFKLKGEVKALQQNVNDACNALNNLSGKEILIIIDGLDRLTSDVAKNIFFNNYDLLSDTPAKMIYAFPLDTYYDSDYIKFAHLYEEIFIPICNLTDINGNNHCLNKDALSEMVYKRIAKEYVHPEALLYLVDMSGGLLRDLVKFMNDACKLALIAKETQVTTDIAKIVVERKINELDRLFDYFKYKEVIIEMERDRRNISKDYLVYLLHQLFAFEYREGTDVWYIIHPCLKQALTALK